jgi:hypothetical protein
LAIVARGCGEGKDDVNPLLPRALVALAVFGMAAAAAIRASQGPTRSADDPRYRPRGRFGAGWNPFGDGGLFGSGLGSGFGSAFGPDRAPPIDARAILTRAQLAQVRDALSGASLDPDRENFRCARCQSYYSVESVRALASENGARCLSCHSIHRVPIEVADA